MDLGFLLIVQANKNNFTATGYYFAKELRAKLKVPVGLLKAPWGGKKIQPFIPSTQYKTDSKMSAYYDQEMANVKKAHEGFDPKKADEDHKSFGKMERER